MNRRSHFAERMPAIISVRVRLGWFLRLASCVLLIGSFASGPQAAFAATGHPDSSFLRVTPSSAVVALGESASFTVVDHLGRPLADAQWFLSDPIANLDSPLDGAIGGIGLYPKSPGRAVLTASAGGLSATATVSVVEQKDLVATTVLWSLDPWPGYEALLLRQAGDSAEGPDFLAVDWSKTSRAIVRGLKSDGRQMWLAHLASMASPLSLKRRLPTSGKLYLAGKELKGSRDMLIGEDNTFFLGGLFADGSVDLKPGDAPLFVRDSGDDWGGLVFLERGPVADALVDLSGVNGGESWRFASAGRLAADWTVNLEGDVAIVETLYNPPSASLLVLNGHSGAIRFRIPFPTSSSKVENFKCTEGNELLNVRASPAGSVFTSTDGNMYVQVEVHNESAHTACGSQQGSHSFENTLSLLQVAPDGTANWRVFAQFHSDGNSIFHAQERAFAGETIPDGLGGVLAAWTYVFPGVKGREKPRIEARVSRLNPVEQRDFTLPMANWTPGLSGLFDENMVLGEGDVLYATNSQTLVSFHIPSGETKWVRQPPTGAIEIHHSTAGGGILVSNQGRLTYFDAEGRGVNLPWTEEVPGNASDIGLCQTDLFAHSPAPALALRDVQLYFLDRFIAAEAGSPAGLGRFIMFLGR